MSLQYQWDPKIPTRILNRISISCEKMRINANYFIVLQKTFIRANRFGVQVPSLFSSLVQGSLVLGFRSVKGWAAARVGIPGTCVGWTVDQSLRRTVGSGGSLQLQSHALHQSLDDRLRRAGFLRCSACSLILQCRLSPPAVRGTHR